MSGVGKKPQTDIDVKARRGVAEAPIKHGTAKGGSGGAVNAAERKGKIPGGRDS